MPESHPRPGKARILSKKFHGIRVGRRCLDGGCGGDRFRGGSRRL